MLQATGADPRVGVVMIQGSLRRAPRGRTSALAALDALRGAPWVLDERRRVPATVEARLSASDRPQRTSTARRYLG